MKYKIVFNALTPNASLPYIVVNATTQTVVACYSTMELAEERIAFLNEQDERKPEYDRIRV